MPITHAPIWLNACTAKWGKTWTCNPHSNQHTNNSISPIEAELSMTRTHANICQRRSPRSDSILSHSSRMKCLMCFRLRDFCLARANRRPGVPTTMCGQFFCSTSSSFRTGIPPKKTAVLMLLAYLLKRSYSLLIWNASSRVWAITKTDTCTTSSTGKVPDRTDGRIILSTIQTRMNASTGLQLRHCGSNSAVLLLNKANRCTIFVKNCGKDQDHTTANSLQTVVWGKQFHAPVKELAPTNPL